MFHDPIAENKFSQLVKQFGIIACVETGTHLGHGALNAAKYCHSVYTCEVNEEHRDKAIVNWVHAGYSVREEREVVLCNQDVSLIASYLQSSPDFLRYLLATHFGPTVFYLDAHWGQHWPLRDEMNAIAEWPGKNECVIIIHDFKVPGKNFGFDTHCGVDLDMNYVRAHLDKINPKFKLFCNQEAEGNCRGILYATP